MSKKDFLNEDEINKFLARSDDEDEDSDWDDIGEVNADEYLKANSKPSSPKFVKSIEEKTPKRKDVVTFRKSMSNLISYASLGFDTNFFC